MHYTTGNVGRVIVMRLEDGDPVYECIQKTAAAENITHAMVWIIGGVTNGNVVVGPDDYAPDAKFPFSVLSEKFTDRREIAGTGMLMPASDGVSRLHMHAAIGKGTEPIVGCPRLGLDCWLVNEVVMLELSGVNARRIKEPQSGFELLTI